MTQKEENTIRSASKFLRTIYAEDAGIYASIIDAEANILSNNKVADSISTLIEGLNAINIWCKLISSELNKLKEIEL